VIRIGDLCWNKGLRSALTGRRVVAVELHFKIYLRPEQWSWLPYLPLRREPWSAETLTDWSLHPGEMVHWLCFRVNAELYYDKADEVAVTPANKPPVTPD
jgi:hypothetical protein